MASFVLPIISGLAGLFGGGSTKQTQTNQTTNQSQNQNQTYGNTNTSTPNLNPFQQQLAQMFTKGAMDQFQSGTNMAPYTSQGLQQIQGQGTANSKAIANNLAARGLSYSPAAGNAMTQNTLNTGGQMNSFLQGVPLLQRQLQQGNLQQLMQAFSTMPTGVTSTGTGEASGTSSGTSTTNGTQTQSTPGGLLSGLFGGLGAGLAAPNANPGGESNLSAILKMFGIGGSGASAASPNINTGSGYYPQTGTKW
jgi:hypothetical protein